VPFFDVAVDAGMLTQLIPDISERFGLIENRKSAIDLESRDIHWSAIRDRTVDFAGLMATRGIVKKTVQGFGGRGNVSAPSGGYNGGGGRGNVSAPSRPEPAPARLSAPSRPSAPAPGPERRRR
ncbi:MAG: hypothetical protein ABI321_13765, partial [Polyangia bacterium]